MDVMQTTLDIDDDVLIAIRTLANQQGSTAEKIISQLLRQSLQETHNPEKTNNICATVRNGFALLPHDGNLVTTDIVEKLFDDSSSL